MATRTKAEPGVKPPRVRDDQPAREPPKVVAISPGAPAIGAGLKDLYELGEIPPLGHVPEADVRLGHPQGTARAARDRHAGRGGADLGARQPRRARARDGRRRQLQRRMGRAGHTHLAVRRAQAALSHRRLRRVRHHLRRRLQGEALEGRRRGRHPLQPGRRRRRGVQRRRSDVLAQPAHLGLRDAGRLLRPVLPRAGPPADGAAQAPHLGRERLLHPGAGHRLSHAVRPSPARDPARPERAGVGRIGRARLDGGAADRHLGRQCHRRRLGRRQARFRHAARRARRHQPQEIQLLGRAAQGQQRPSTTPGSRRRASSAPPSGRSPARATTSTSCSSIRARRRSRSRCWW